MVIKWHYHVISQLSIFMVFWKLILNLKINREQKKYPLLVWQWDRKIVPRISVWHHKACQVTNGDLERLILCHPTLTSHIPCPLDMVLSQDALTLFLLVLSLQNLCKQLDPDQARQNVRLSLDLTVCMTFYWSWFWNKRDDKISMQNYPAYNELNVVEWDVLCIVCYSTGKANHNELFAILQTRPTIMNCLLFYRQGKS